jgi:SAM-dependent methyltransferase
VNALTRHYAKLCDVRDFEDPELLDTIRSLVPERDPAAYIERKVWEFAMVMLFLRDTGHLDGRSRVLSVGAGNERVLFWLTNHVGCIVATDIYGEGRFAGQEAEVSMLTDPAAHAPAYPWRPDRLEVHRMDARTLEFEDKTFDAVFSVSSIEHFGTPPDIARAAGEIGRVLRPGGHAVVLTDMFVRRHPLNAAPADFAVRLGTLGRRRFRATPRRRAVLGEVFTRRELARDVVEASGLRPLQPLKARISAESERHPAIVVRAGRSAFTSVCVVLVKPGPDNPGADARL